MIANSNRRAALLSLTAAAGLAGAATARAAGSPAAKSAGETGSLKTLMALLARAPRRRDFKSVPMVLEDQADWDHQALTELFAYGGGHKQVWDNTDIGGGWLNGMRNSLNGQVFAFKHPNFLIVSATHGTAHLALLDQAMWDKYRLAQLAGGGMTANSMILPPAKTGDVHDHESPESPFSGENGANLPALMRRGAVFLACHNALWELSAKLIKNSVNPDRLSQDVMVAELTNHLAPGVVLTPGVAATIPELQGAGYFYIK
jgi:hypothetical protein